MYLRTGTELPCFLLGTEFAPLREEFQNLPDRTVKKRAKEILISAGGADLEHISVGLTGYIIENLCRERRDNAVQKGLVDGKGAARILERIIYLEQFVPDSEG